MESLNFGSDRKFNTLLFQLLTEHEKVLAENKLLKQKLKENNIPYIETPSIDINKYSAMPAKDKGIFTKSATTYRFKPYMQLTGHCDCVWEVSSNNNNNIVTASADTTSNIYNKFSKLPIAVYTGHRGSVNSARFNNNSNDNLVVTSSGDCTAHVYVCPYFDLEDSTNQNDVNNTRILSNKTKKDKRSNSWPSVDSNNNLKSLQNDRKEPTLSHLVDKDSKPALSSWAREITTPRLVLLGHAAPVMAADWIGNDVIVTGSWDKTVKCWSIDGKEISSRTVGKISNVTTYSKYFLAASQEGTFTLYDMRSSIPVNEFDYHKEPVTTAIFSPNGDFIASAAEDLTVQIWDMRRYVRPVTSIQLTACCNRLAFSPSGLSITTPCDDSTIKCYNMSGDLTSTFDTTNTDKEKNNNLLGSTNANISNSKDNINTKDNIVNSKNIQYYSACYLKDDVSGIFVSGMSLDIVLYK